MTLRRSMAARWAAPQKPPKAAPPIPETRESRRLRSRHSPHDGPGAHATTKRHTRRITRRIRSSPPPAEQRTGNRGTARHTTATTAPPETQQRPYAILRSTGKGPVLTSRPAARTARPSEPLVRFRATPQARGPAAQQWMAMCSGS